MKLSIVRTGSRFKHSVWFTYFVENKELSFFYLKNCNRIYIYER
jgi:hypothetical protein